MWVRVGCGGEEGGRGGLSVGVRGREGGVCACWCVCVSVEGCNDKVCVCVCVSGGRR